ncbi:WRKY transcription factor 22 [Acorus calamus]|uniref:WRKY transcription factor 22 n=1 Tax=Acorus calamus TaxID=4465 RepID=A0AAV9FJI3_ACOCL|nr:WRKY transcription factor 22 [Acorus calamus]
MTMDDWDLHAVVRGCNASSTTDPLSLVNDCWDSLSGFTGGADDINNDGLFFRFPDLWETQTAIEDLEALCKPFFQINEPPNQGNQGETSEASPLVQQHPPEQQQQQQRQRPHIQKPISQIPRSKRKKNQQKKVVCQVPADGLSSDMWAWRKYGQKPIKGSPYPRGYYRCSSSKGCLARKQVERCRSDPSMFVITYTAEHNHPLPTHRNSLAGSTRHKLPQHPISQGDAPVPTTTTPPKPPLSPSVTAAGLSPVTPMSSNSIRPDEEVEDEEDDLLMGEDVFMDLQDIGGFDNDQHFPVPPHWSSINNTATAAGGS